MLLVFQKLKSRSTAFIGISFPSKESICHLFLDFKYAIYVLSAFVVTEVLQLPHSARVSDLRPIIHINFKIFFSLKMKLL